MIISYKNKQMTVMELQDYETHRVDAILITESTPEEIQKIISGVKEYYEDSCTWNDIVAHLPADCKVYKMLKNDKSIVYY